MGTIINGEAFEELKRLPSESVDCCITSPPYYGLRDYGTGKWIGGDANCPHKRLSKQSVKTITGHAQDELKGNVGDAIYKQICPLCGAVREDKQIGLEETPEAYIKRLVDVFHEVKRVLKPQGTLWVNIGDTYNQSSYHKDEKTSGHGKQGTNRGVYENVVERPHAKNCKTKDLIGIPWMLAFALRGDGWYLRQDIIWHKPNPMPESVKDRCTKSHEYIFLLSKEPHYYFDYKAIQEPSKWAETDKRAGQGRITYDGKRLSGGGYEQGAQQAFVSISEMRNKRDVWEAKEYKNLEYNGQQNHTMHERRAEGLPDIEYEVRTKRDVWSVSTKAVKEAHFATFPEELIEPCVLAGCPIGGIVLDPFFGSGTTGRVATAHSRDYIGIELNPAYITIGVKRTSEIQLKLF